MTPYLLSYLCEPTTKLPLQLVDAVTTTDGTIQSGNLVSTSGRSYPIINGIPRFIDSVPTSSVKSFGDEWNYFNFTDFKINWLTHTVANTFGTPDVFKGRLIVDAGGGSGAQSKWFLEYGASHVIMMDLSHSVDEVVQHNLTGFKNVDVIQCSIDAPPLRDRSIDGIVYCHNVIQHTPSVEKTAIALFALTTDGGEFCFNCYPLNTEGPLRWVRYHIIYKPLRAILSRMPFGIILFYARFFGIVRLVPGVGYVMEKIGLCVTGDVPKLQGEHWTGYLKRHYKNTKLNTFDNFGSHKFQHLKSEAEIRMLATILQPDSNKILNMTRYFLRPTPVGCALRVLR